MMLSENPVVSRVKPFFYESRCQVKFKSQIATQVSGSVGGTTYAQNQGGMYMRARSIPTNPNSGFQQAVRTFFKQCLNAWTNSLTAAQRAAWSVYDQNTPIIGPLGDSRKIGANAQFLRSNVSRLQGGLARVDSAPTTFDLGSFTQPTFATSINGGSLLATFTTTDSWHTSGGAMLLYASPPQNSSINFFKGPFRYVGTITGAATSPQTFVLPFTAGGTNTCMFIKTAATQPDGRLSTPSIVKSVPV